MNLWLGTEGDGPVRCSAWLGGVGLVLVSAWIIVFILWVRALVAYLNAYREYQKRHGEPYQSPCERNYLARVTLKCLRALFLGLGNDDHQLGHERSLARLIPSGVNHGIRVKLLHLRNQFFGAWIHRGVKPPNDPSSATRPAGRVDCNNDAMAGFAAAHG